MNFLGNIISGQDIVNKAYVDDKVGNAGGNITVDTELSETSENPIANKTVAKALSEVADAFEGKQNTIADLDEIRAGAAKGATAIQSVKTINGQSIVGSGNIGIEPYNDTEIKAQIANKQDVLISNINIKTINGESVLGSGNIIVEADTTNLATKTELNGVSEQVTGKQDKLVSGTSIKTINGESILGEGNIVVNVDTSNLATKEELTSLTNEIIDDEEVLAHAINDLNNRVNELAENVSGEAATKVDLADAVSTINATINANDERYEGEFSVLDDRIDELAANVSGETVTKVEFEEEVTNITNEVIDDEEVLAYAINDLKSMIDALTARVNALESNNA